MTAALAQTPLTKQIDRDDLARAVRQGRLSILETGSAYAACLVPLLRALGWTQNLRQLTEALPHFADALGLDQLEEVLAQLGYLTVSTSTDLATLDERLLPCLFVSQDGDVFVILGGNENRLRVYDGNRRTERYIPRTPVQGRIHIIRKHEDLEVHRPVSRKRWVAEFLMRFRSQAQKIMAFNAVIGFLALALPIFIMTIYDAIIPSQSMGGLGVIGVAIVLVLLIELCLHIIRTHLTSYLGARVDYLLSTNAFSRVLTLPAPYMETVSVGTQINKLKEFNAVRSLFSGAIFSGLLELPIVCIFLGAIFFIGGSLFLVPVLAAATALCMSALLYPFLRRSSIKTGQTKSNHYAFTLETISDLGTIKALGLEQLWQKRYREKSAEAAYAHYLSERLSFINLTLTNTIVSMAGAATLLFGVFAVLEETLTVGALIAVMALTWRTLSPIQTILTSLFQLTQLSMTFRQIDSLMSLPSSETETRHSGLKKWLGAVELQRVGFRYSQTTQPTLMNINLRVEPGEFVGIIGSIGAGKTTLLKILCGLHTPQIGQVLYDGTNARQINTQELRQLIAYVPQQLQLFHGTIAQNLRLAQPTATDCDLMLACEQAGILEEVERLAKGLDTRLTESVIRSLSPGFKNKLVLARAYTKQAPVLVLDDVDKSLDEEGSKALQQTLAALKGRTTVILASHQPDNILGADKIYVLKNGTIANQL